MDQLEKNNIVVKAKGGLKLQGINRTSSPEKPLVSVVTIVLNGDNYLEETIRSVIDQDYDNIEYLIVDGGSTDGTLDIIKKYQEHIDLWISGKDTSIYDAMNKGVKFASGSIINMMNCGDYLPSNDIVSKVVNIFNKNIDLSFVLGRCKFINEDGSDYNISGKKMVVSTLKAGRFNTICHQAFFYKKSLHQDFGFYNFRYKICADGHFMYRVYYSQRHQHYLLDKIIAVRREQGLSTALPQALLEQRQVFNEVFGKSLLNELLLVKYCLRKNKFGKMIYRLYSKTRHAIMNNNNQ